MTYYINRESGRYNETVDEFEDYKEARTMCAEYQFSEHGRAYYSVSQVPRSNWKDD
jgi:hypothetical protein